MKTLAFALLASSLAAGCDDTDPISPEPAAQVRVVHASPDAPNVDVLLDNAVVLSNVPFKASSNYLAVPAGSRNVKVRAAGTSTVVIDANAPLNAEKSYTILATGRVASIAPLVLEDNLTNPPAGNIKLRLVHGSPTAGTVDIYVTAPGADITSATPTLANVAFRAASGYLEVPAGTYRVRITPAGTKTVAIDVNNVVLTAGGNPHRRRSGRSGRRHSARRDPAGRQELVALRTSGCMKAPESMTPVPSAYVYAST